MNDQPTYEELNAIRKAHEQRISSLEQQLEQYTEIPDILTDTGLFGELFQKAADMIIIAESDPSGRPGKILLANQAAQIRLEYSLEEIQKLSFMDLIEGSIRTIKKDALYPETIKYEKTFNTKSGKKIHSDVNSHLFLYGKEKYSFSILRDISDRQEMEDAIRHSEEKYKRLVESLSDEYIFYAHDRSGMITYLSPAITRVMGYSQEEAMRNYREFLTGHEMNAEALLHSEESLKGNIQPPFMNELYHRDGSTRIFYNTELPIYNEKGEIAGVEGIEVEENDIENRIEAMAGVHNLTPAQLRADLEEKGSLQRLGAFLLAEKTLYRVADYAGISRASAPSDTERESLEDKLRSLGYIR